MKLLCLSLLLAFQIAAFGRDTAYQALRFLGTERGKDLLNHVIEVQGRGGSPQPSVWRVVVDDPSARGGIREFEIAKGKIISEHTPLRAYSGVGSSAVMDFQKLNLDSDGAFTVANQDANRARIGFDSVDYVLRTGDDATAPMWILQLFDSSSGRVGTLHVAADTGKVVSSQIGGGPYRDSGPDRRYAGDVPPATPPPDDGNSDKHNVAHDIDKHLHRMGATLQQFFTGKRTIDQRFQGEP